MTANSVHTADLARRARRWLIRGMGVAALCGALLAHGSAASAYEACRSDPVLVVNGSIVDVVSTLQTAPSAVRELDYTITVPSGSLLGQTTLTVGLGFPERVSYVFSHAQPWGTLQIAATVQTQPGTAPFPTEVQASSLLARSTGYGSSDATVGVFLGHQIMLGL